MKQGEFFHVEELGIIFEFSEVRTRDSVRVRVHMPLSIRGKLRKMTLAEWDSIRRLMANRADGGTPPPEIPGSTPGGSSPPSPESESRMISDSGDDFEGVPV